MKIALDTNAYANFLRGDTSVVATVAAATEIFMPVIVVGELLAGFACGQRQAENRGNLQRFFQSPKVRTLSVDTQTAEIYGDLFSRLRRQGTPIPTNDLWIAALVVQHQVRLCSQDRHFDALPEIRRC